MNDTANWISGTQRNVHVFITEEAKLYSEKFCEVKIILKFNKRNRVSSVPLPFPRIPSCRIVYGFRISPDKVFSINNGNRTEWSPFRSVIIRVINKIGRPRSGSPICKKSVKKKSENKVTVEIKCFGE